MAQKTSWTGATLTESDINTYLMGEGGAWTTWTPAITQSGSVTATVTHAVYGRWGRLIVASCSLSVTGAGTGANAVTVSLPVTAARSGTTIGVGSVFDTSASTTYTANVITPSTTTVQFYAQGTSVSTSPTLGSFSFTAALAAGDVITFQVMYEAAS
jgi:hypothetical protein